MAAILAETTPARLAGNVISDRRLADVLSISQVQSG
jgi:hypothetical protein